VRLLVVNLVVDDDGSSEVVVEDEEDNKDEDEDDKTAELLIMPGDGPTDETVEFEIFGDRGGALSPVISMLRLSWRIKDLFLEVTEVKAKKEIQARTVSATNEGMRLDDLRADASMNRPLSTFAEIPAMKDKQ